LKREKKYFGIFCEEKKGDFQKERKIVQCFTFILELCCVFICDPISLDDKKK